MRLPGHRVTLAAVLVAYAALAFGALSLDVVSSGDVGVKFVQARALADSGFRSLAIPYRGAVVDPERAFTPFRPPFVLETPSGTQAIFPPAVAVTQALFVRFGGIAGLRLLCLLGAGVILWSASRLADTPPWVPVVLGFGTPLWFYATTESEHAPAVALSTAAFAMAATGRLPHVLLAGALLGAAATLRDECALLLPGLIAALWWKTRSFKTIGGSLAACVLVLLTAAGIEVLWFDRPLAAHLQHAVHFARSALHVTSLPNPELPALEPMTLRERYDTIVDYWILGTATTVPIALMALATIVAAAVALRGDRRPMMAVLLMLSTFAILDAAALVRAPRFVAGLYRLSPFLIFAVLPRAPDDRGAEWLHRVTLVGLIGYLVLAWLGLDTTGGKSLGPRLLLPLLPLLAVSALLNIRGYVARTVPVDRVIAACGIVLVGASLMIHLGGTVRAWIARSHQDALRLAAIVASDQRILVADDMFTAQQLLPLYYRRIILLAEGSERGAALGAVLDAQRIPSVLLVSRRFTPNTTLPPLQTVWTSGQYRYVLQIWRR